VFGRKKPFFTCKLLFLFLVMLYLFMCFIFQQARKLKGGGEKKMLKCIIARNILKSRANTKMYMQGGKEGYAFIIAI